jgi:uncharacterized protein (DUF885 family)
MKEIVEKVHYNGFVKCYSTLTMTKEAAQRWSLDHMAYLRCQQPSGFKWWYFKHGFEVTADDFYPEEKPF